MCPFLYFFISLKAMIALSSVTEMHLQNGAKILTPPSTSIT